MDSHAAPPSLLTSMFTSPLPLTEVQVIFSIVPIVHVSPPFGEVTVISGVSIMLNAVSLTSLTPAAAELILTRQRSDVGPLTVHSSTPSFGVASVAERSAIIAAQFNLDVSGNFIRRPGDVMRLTDSPDLAAIG